MKITKKEKGFNERIYHKREKERTYESMIS